MANNALQKPWARYFGNKVNFGQDNSYSLMDRKEYFFSKARRSGSEGAGSGWMLSGRAMLRLQMGV